MKAKQIISLVGILVVLFLIAYFVQPKVFSVPQNPKTVIIAGTKVTVTVAKTDMEHIIQQPRMGQHTLSMEAGFAIQD